MSTQTPRKAPANKRPAPITNPVPPGMKSWRPVITVVASTIIVAAIYYAGINLGRNRPLWPAAIIAGIGLALFIAGQTRALYEWAGRDNSPVVAHADQAPPRKAPKQRDRRSQQPAEATAPAEQDGRQIPTVKPGPSLGPGFRYIVSYTRWLVTEHPDVFDDMEAFWSGIDWESDDPDDGFREVVDFLYDQARALPAWNEDVTAEQMFAGTIERGNPFPFVAELESYHPLAAAVAVLMLTRKNGVVDSDDFDVVMEPWTQIGLPYRLEDSVFSIGDDGQYHGKQVETRRPPAPTPGVARTAAPVTDGTNRPPADLNEVLAARAAGPAPVPPPTPAPAPAVEKHIEPDRDDVPDPGADMILHAAELIISSQNGSPIMIQRKLRIGVPLAAKVMFRLYEYDIIGQVIDDRGTREVMVAVAELDDTLDFLREQEAERAKR